MLNYKGFILLENNQIDKIKKFCNIPEIYNLAYKLNPKFSVWIANSFMEKIKQEFFDLWHIMSLFVSRDSENEIYMSRSEGDHVDKELNKSKKFIKKYFEDYFKGEVKDSVLTDIINYMVEKEDYGAKYKYILDWFTSPLRDPNEKITLKGLTFDQAYKDSLEWHQSLKAGGIIHDEKGEIYMTFPDGYYWIDLQTNECEEEGEAMGHCGTSEGDLYSLRKNKSPHVTIALNDDNQILQIKGRNNKKPIEKYHTYIVDFLIKIDAQEYELEYDTGDDLFPTDLSPELLTELIKDTSQLGSWIIDQVLFKESQDYEEDARNKVLEIIPDIIDKINKTVAKKILLFYPREEYFNLFDGVEFYASDGYKPGFTKIDGDNVMVEKTYYDFFHNFIENTMNKFPYDHKYFETEHEEIKKNLFEKFKPMFFSDFKFKDNRDDSYLKYDGKTIKGFDNIIKISDKVYDISNNIDLKNIIKKDKNKYMKYVNKIFGVNNVTKKELRYNVSIDVSKFFEFASIGAERNKHNIIYYDEIDLGKLYNYGISRSEYGRYTSIVWDEYKKYIDNEISKIL